MLSKLKIQSGSKIGCHSPRSTNKLRFFSSFEPGALVLLEQLEGTVGSGTGRNPLDQLRWDWKEPPWPAAPGSSLENKWLIKQFKLWWRQLATANAAAPTSLHVAWQCGGRPSLHPPARDAPLQDQNSARVSLEPWALLHVQSSCQGTGAVHS